nr:hypothetical protein [Tanacetum cinerariifolium]
MQMQESKVVLGKALDADLVVMESNRTKSDKQDTSSSLGNYITHAVEVDIRLVNDQVPFTEKCVFNANHDACVTKFLNEVNSRTRKPSHKTTTRYKPVEKTSNTKKSLEQIPAGHMFSTTKSSIVQKKTNNHRSCLMWILTGRVFKIVGLRWIPTRKIFTSSTTKVGSKPPNGSNEDITNIYECKETLNASAGLLQNISSPTPAVPPIKNEWDSLFQPMFDEYFNPPPIVDHPVPEVPTPVPDASTSSPSSTSIDQDAPQNQMDLLMDNPLVSVEVLRYDIKRSKSENKGIVSTEMELVLEQTQQVSSSLRSVKPKRTIESKANSNTISDVACFEVSVKETLASTVNLMHLR